MSTTFYKFVYLFLPRGGALRHFLSILALGLVIGFPQGNAEAATPYLLKDFKLHDFDAQIRSAFGYETVTVLYTREFASVTMEERNEMTSYERIGCSPFYVMQDGKRGDKGYNCITFFCSGYEKGTKQCRTQSGAVYGGIVEIQRRQKDVPPTAEQKFFKDFATSDQSQAMRQKVSGYGMYSCHPFYLMKFNVAVGEGYKCDEIGQFPRYTPTNTCTDDWRDRDGYVCTIPERSNEVELRGYKTSSSAASSSSVSSPSTGSGTAASSSSTGPLITFPDVIEGRYGYTAIMDLTASGIITGYPDGTFQPERPINRAEFFKILLKALRPNDELMERFCFPDVDRQWFAGAVCRARSLGWVEGYPDGRFRPGQGLRKEEGIKIVVSTLGKPLTARDPLPQYVPEGEWFTPYVRQAVAERILLEKALPVGQPATRADAAVWIYRTRKWLTGAESQ